MIKEVNEVDFDTDGSILDKLKPILNLMIDIKNDKLSDPMVWTKELYDNNQEGVEKFKKFLIEKLVA